MKCAAMTRAAVALPKRKRKISMYNKATSYKNYILDIDKVLESHNFMSSHTKYYVPSCVL